MSEFRVLKYIKTVIYNDKESEMISDMVPRWNTNLRYEVTEITRCPLISCAWSAFLWNMNIGCDENILWITHP